MTSDTARTSRPTTTTTACRRPCRAVAARLLASAALAGGLLGMAGCSVVSIDTGRTLSHSYRGVPDDDLAVTPAQELANLRAEPLAPPPAETPGAKAPAGHAQADARPTAAPRPQQQPAARPVDLTWVSGPASQDARTVNIFGEIDGQPRPQARATGDAGFQQHTFTDEGADADVNVDPTGKWLVFSSTRHSDHPDVYVQRVDGSAVTQLTSDAADDAYPSFSPDGRHVAFASTRAGSWQIYVMDVDGRNVVQVTQGAMQCIHPSFSPDGTRIVYSAIGSRSNQWELWVANLQTSEKRMVGYGLFPRWSPEKGVDRIAFQRARQRGGRWFSLWTLDLIEGEGRRLTEVAASTNAAIVWPTWSPNGKRIAFATVTAPPPAPVQTQNAKGEWSKPPAPARGTRQYGQQDIWSIDADGGNRQRLTDGNGTNLSPCWSADSRIYFISDRGGNECVWSVRADAARAVDVAAGGSKQPAPHDANAAVDPLDGN